MKDTKRRVTLMAQLVAFTQFKRRNPRGSDAAAHAYSRRHWREHIDTAVDILACCQALDEQEEALAN